MKNLRSSRRTAQGVLAVALAAALSLAATPGESATPVTPELRQAPAPPPAKAIPQAEVATQAVGVSDLLRTLGTNLAPSPEIETIQQSFPEVRRQIEREFAGTRNALLVQPTFEALQARQQSWHGRLLQTTRWLNVITKRANELQEALNHLAGLRATWARTRDAAQAPGPIVKQIETVLAAIAAAQAPLQTQQDAVLDLESSVAKEVTRCEDALSQISEARRRAVGGLLTRESPPIWSTELWLRSRTDLSVRVRQSAAEQWRDIEQYLRDPSQGMPAYVGLFALLALLLGAARRWVQRWAAAGQGLSFATAVFEYPYAAAFAATLLVVSTPSLPMPPAVRHLFLVLGLVPMIRLTRPVVDPRLVPALYAVAMLYVLDAVRQAFGGAPLFEQALLLVETVAGMAVLGWSLAFGKLRRSPPTGELRRFGAVRLGARLIFLALAAGLVAGVLGYLRLAGLLVSTVLGGAVLALVLFVSVQVLGGAVAIALRVRPLRRLQLVQHHRELLERRAHRLLIWLAIGGWLARWLDYLGLFQPTLSFGAAVLAARFERGSISLSLGDVVAFLLTVWVAYLLSAFIRFVLQEDVYPRKGIPRGASYAFSSLLHYIILALGFMVGLGVLGVDFTKVTVLVGAFGVGLGFGLQSVVNNFVSGLILLFERPVHVGDTIEIGDLQGEVRRIGIRASTVRTWHGADIIVPNAQFITANVTNWTLSDRLRRIDLPVGVSYGAAPRQVIELLQTVARANLRVLQDPPPQGLFLGYGDSSIDFELRAWTDQFASWQQIRSELASAVYDAVYAAGLSFPFPQREVRLLGDREAGASPFPQPGKDTEPAAGNEGEVGSLEASARGTETRKGSEA